MKLCRLHLKPQDVGEARAIRYLLEKVTYREGVERAQERKLYCSWQSWKAGTSIRHRTTGFGVCPAEFSVGSIFLDCDPTPLFGMVVYVLCHWTLEVCNLLFGIIGLIIKRVP